MTDNPYRVMHENERYVITVSDPQSEDVVEVYGATYLQFYVVTNKETGVIECKCPALCDAIIFAENGNSMLESKPWEWRKETAAAADLVAAAADSPVGKH